MVVEYIRYEIPADRRQAFEASYREGRRILEASDHCLAYELTRCTEEPSAYVVRIEWDSIDGHIKGFRRDPAFRSFLSAVGPFISDIKEMRHYEVIS